MAIEAFSGDRDFTFRVQGTKPLTAKELGDAMSRIMQNWEKYKGIVKQPPVFNPKPSGSKFTMDVSFELTGDQKTRDKVQGLYADIVKLIGQQKLGPTEETWERGKSDKKSAVARRTGQGPIETAW